MKKTIRFVKDYFAERARVRREKNRIIKQRKRARKSQVPNTLEYYEWKLLLMKYNYRCAYCGRLISKMGDISIDHVIPISKGGSNEIKNILPACKKCNSDKGSKLLSEWIEEYENVIEEN